MNSSLPLDILNHIYNEYIPRTKFTTERERIIGLGQPDTCLAEVFPVKLYPVKIDPSKNIFDYSGCYLNYNYVPEKKKFLFANIIFKRSLEEIYILYHHNPEVYHRDLEHVKRIYELHLEYHPQYKFDDFEDYAKNFSTKMEVYEQKKRENYYRRLKCERLGLQVIDLSDFFE